VLFNTQSQKSINDAQVLKRTVDEWISTMDCR
jgi:hypothetical protein